MRFKCQPGCIACCTQKGWVYLTEDDIKRAARFLGMRAATFEKRYVYRMKTRRRLRRAMSACPFLDGAGCSIHPAKPTQCRAFPFWPELVGDRKEWRTTGRRCPGIGRGELVTIEAALRVAGEMREGYPGMYGD